MILVRRRSLLLFILLSVAGIAVLALRGYGLLRAAGPAGRLQGEEQLFLALVFALALAALFLLLFLRNRHVLRELDKIVELGRSGGFTLQQSLRRLGVLGEKIMAINSRLGELNEMRMLRISALGGINAFLVNNVQLALILTDVTGRVSDLSPAAAEKLQVAKDSAGGRNLEELLPGLDFSEIVSHLEKEHTQLVVPRGKELSTFYPILNRDSQLSNVVCVLGKAEVVSEGARRREETARATSRFRGLVRKYLGARR